MGTDPHYYHCEDTVSPVETGPKAPCSLTVRSCTPFNGDEEEFNEVGSVPHEDAPCRRCEYGTEFSAITMYPDRFTYSAKKHGVR